MNQSKQLDFQSLANRLHVLLLAKTNPNSCRVTHTDTRIVIHGGICSMIPHTVIVLAYRFAIDHNLLMFFDTDNACFILH